MNEEKLDSGDDVEGLSLLGALSQLKRDILALQEEGKRSGQPALFLIQEGELELKLVARRELKGEANAKAKFGLYLFDSSASAAVAGGASRECVQTLKIKFSALDATNVHNIIEKEIPIGFGSSTDTVRSPTVQADGEGPTGKAP